MRINDNREFVCRLLAELVAACFPDKCEDLENSGKAGNAAASGLKAAAK